MSAAQTSIPKEADIIGTIGTVCWCIQIIPQIWHNWRRKNTEGLPGIMLLLWAAAPVPMGAYLIIKNCTIALELQPQIFCALCLLCWAQTLVYYNKWRTWTALLTAVFVGIVFGGLEILLILTLRKPFNNGITWPVTMIGIIAAVVLVMGLIPIYMEIWKRRGRVVGINFVFLGIDWVGAFFSLIALVVQHTFDYLGGVLYIVCLILELGIISSHVAWRYRNRRIRCAARQAGKTYDEYIALQKGGHTSTARTSQVTLHHGTDGTERDLEKGDKVDVREKQTPV